MAPSGHATALIVHTIGHSTHAITDFVAMLEAYAIEQLVDVRTLPRSRRNPQFSQPNLEPSLAAAGVAYSHSKVLGGLRKPAADSINGGWRNPSFRGYADHMQTAQFAAAIDALIALAAARRTAVMCAESVPWRCHRSLIGDALIARNVTVIDILSRGESRPHTLTPFARMDGTRVTYPPAQPELPL